MTAADSPEAYLAGLSPDKRATLETVRAAIRAAAPGADEGMRYGMPCFIQGKAIAGYAASDKHCSYHPMSGKVVVHLSEALAGYETSKGTIRFPVGKPLPKSLIRKLVEARLAEVGPSTAPRAGAKGKAKKTVTPRVASAPRAQASKAKVTANVEGLFWELAAELQDEDPRVVEGTIMSSRCLRVGDEFLALCDYKGSGLVVKLSKDRVAEEISKGHGQPFAPANKVFKEWLSVPTPDKKRWRSLLREGVRYVSPATATKKAFDPAIDAYNQNQEAPHAEVCALLATEISKALPDAENKIWHSHPVWFLNGNPIVGYSQEKPGIRLMFWSGVGFDEPGLNVVGKKFKDASVFYNVVADVKIKDLRRWLKKSRSIQWDYANIRKNHGLLRPLA